MKKVIIFSEIVNNASHNILQGILKFVNEKANWEIRPIVYPDYLTSDIVLSAKENGYDGIIAHGRAKKRLYKVLQNVDIPLSIITWPLTMPPQNKAPTALVDLDDVKIGELGASFLNSLGRFRCFAFAGASARHKWSEDRKSGFIRFLDRIHIKPIIIDAENPLEAVKTLPRPAAVMVAWDMKAIEFVQAAHTAGLHVPNDISILGVDADPLVCNSTTPALSSVDPNFERLGYAAAAALDALMSGRKRDHVVKVFCQPKGIVARKSTRYIPPAEPLLIRAKQLIARESTSGLTVANLASRLGVSIQLLSLRFKQYEQTTPGELIILTKLNKVKKMLAHANSDLATVAHECGFNSANRLSHLFKDRIGLSIREWNKQRYRQ